MIIRNPVVILDVETGIEENNVSGPGGRVNPYAGVPLVVIGHKIGQTSTLSWWKGVGTRADPSLFLRTLEEGTKETPIIVVGHNVNFDLHHVFLNCFELITSLPFLHFTIWDTQAVEYYLSGQHVRMCKLKDLEGYHPEFKRHVEKDEMQGLFEAGIGVDKMDQEMVAPYLEDDLNSTQLIFEAQFLVAKQYGMLPFLREMMDAQLCTLMMEREGLPIDPEVVKTIQAEVGPELKRCETKALDSMMELFPLQAFVPNPGSPTQISKALVGEPISYIGKEPMLDDEGNPVLFKSGPRKGDPRFRNVQNMADPIRFPLDVREFQGIKANEMPGTSEKQLYALLEAVEDPSWTPFLRSVLALRKASKKGKTYVEGYLTKVDKWGVLRTSINQTVTPTGRVSSSNPNLQNLPSDM